MQNHKILDKSFFQNGENYNVEFKSRLSPKDKTLLKTIVAFANCDGGKVVFGIDDDTCSVIGIDNNELFPLMDSISDKISNSISPQIVPSITFETFGDKTLIIVEIMRGQNTPYYLISEGLGGVYIRVGATTRKAEIEKVKELTLWGNNKSYDEVIESGDIASKNDIKYLCDIIEHYSDGKKVTKDNLIGWKLLKEENKKLLPSVAFKLLTGSGIYFSKIQCALFKGTEKVNFLDRKEFDGPLDKQIENAMTFLLQHINVSAKIEGLIRKDIYEFPIPVLRELVINAVVHRNYLSHSFVQISIFDDRIEITNPGGLYGGITLEKILKGTSSIRNQILADIFSKMNLIEHWGTGIKRICDILKHNKLSLPRFEADNDEFKVILYREKLDGKLPQTGVKIAPKTSGKLPQTYGKTAPKTSNKLPQKDDKIAPKLPDNFTKNTVMLYDVIKSEPSLTVQKLAVKTGLSERAVKYNLSILKKGKYIIREGTNRLGVWKVIK